MIREYSNLTRYTTVLFVVLTLPLVFLISRYNYNLFHSFADGVSIVIAACTFTVVWNARRFVDNDYFMYTGISLLFFAFLDTVHVLGNKNMGVFPGYGNLGPTFYIASRYISSISLITAPLFISRRLNTTLMFALYSLVTSLIVLSVFYWKVFPVCFVEGVGLTRFKIVSDYIICLILLGAAGLLFVNRQSFDSRVFRIMVSSIFMSIATGLVFTLYADPFGVTNMIGHLFQIASFYLIYLAIIETSVTKPQEILFRKLKQNEEKLTENVQQLDHANAELQQEIAERRQTEDALRQSEERFAKAFRSSPVALAITSPIDGTFVDVNDAYERVIGYSRHELIGRKPADFNIYLYPEQRENTILFLTETGKARDLALTLRHKNGQLVDVIASLETVSIGGRELFLSSLIDITDRIRAEKALRESERRWATTLSSIGDAVIATDTAGQITFMNDVAEQLTGWSFVDAASKPVSEVFKIINEYTRKTVDNPVHKVLREGVIVGLANHTLLVTKDGREIPIDDSGAPIKDEKDVVTGVVLIFRDITERRQADAALEESEAKYRNLFMNMAEEVHLWKIIRGEGGGIQTWRLVDANPPTLKTWGRELEEIKGRTTDEIFGPGATEHYIAVVHRIMTEGIPYHFEDYFPHLDKHFRFTSVPIGDHFITTGADITDIKKAQDALQRANDDLEKRVNERTAELQRSYDKLTVEIRERELAEAQLRQAQKIEALGTLTGGIAHDFNNILAAIIGFGEIAKDRAQPDPRLQRPLERVLQAGIRGRDLVKHMLTFARQSEQEKKPVPLSGIVKETTKLLRASIPSTISIRTNVKSESGFVFADPVQMQQVIMNLCANAAFSMKENGGVLKIELSDFSVSSANVNPDGIKPGQYMELTVRDTGSGISPEVIERVFDPFFTTKKPGEGTGLGLSVVHGIVKQHEGYITVESTPGKGTCFFVYLPKVTEEEPAESPAEENVRRGQERVLFVDDEEALAEMGQLLLEELGYTVTVKRSGVEALSLIKADPSSYDIVVTDQTMPEMTGVQLAKEVLALRPDMPVILCTGFSNLIDADQAKAAGIRVFLMKPLTKKEIARTIRQVLDE